MTIKPFEERESIPVYIQLQALEKLQFYEGSCM